MKLPVLRRWGVPKSPHQPIEITRWTADNHARRPPTFVKAATGLLTKTDIVAKYGPATFEKGKPRPPAVGEKTSRMDSTLRALRARTAGRSLTEGRE